MYVCIYVYIYIYIYIYTHIYYVKKFFHINTISVFLKKSIKGSFGPSYNLLYIFKKKKHGIYS